MQKKARAGISWRAKVLLVGTYLSIAVSREARCLIWSRLMESNHISKGKEFTVPRTSQRTFSRRKSFIRLVTGGGFEPPPMVFPIIKSVTLPIRLPNHHAKK
jgi:hypothetical protein